MLETGFIVFIALGLMTMAFVALALTPLFPSFRPNRLLTDPADFARNPRRVSLEQRKLAQTHLGDYERKMPLALADSFYVQGHASIPSHSELKALASDRSIILGSDVSINDWIDAAGHIRTGEHCSLGSYATSLASLTLGPKTSFKNLSALPICTESHAKLPQRALRLKKHHVVIAAGTTVKEELITDQSVFIERGAVIEKPIRTSGDMILEEGVATLANLYAQGNIYVGPNCHICGPLVAEKKLYIGSGTTVGSHEQTQIVYATRGIKLEGNVLIYGQMMTEANGTVV